MSEPDDVLDENLDEKLRAAFAPPPPHVHAAAARAAAAPRAHGPRWPWLLAAAAVAVLGVVFAMTRTTRGTHTHDGHALGAMWVAAYEHAVARGDAGSFCCDPGSDFARTCEQRFAARIVVGASAGASEVELCGCYCGLPTGGCVAAMARTSAGPVGLFVVPRDADPAPRLPRDSDLHLARRELGPVVLYALSSASPAEPLARFELAP